MKKVAFIVGLLLSLSNTFAQTHVEPKLEVVAELNLRPGNVAVSKTGRVFATIHPLGGGNLQVIEITGKKTFVPYPSKAYQKNGNPASDKAFDTPLGLNFDADGFLWVIDMGQELGKTRLWSIDIKTNKVVKKFELSQAIAPRGSFIQDLAVDSKNAWVYLADIANPGIIAVNLKTGKTRRFSYSQFQPEEADMFIDGKLIYFGGSPARVGVNPITLSKDGNLLYFGAMNGLSLYSLNARLIREEKDDNLIGKSIRVVGRKPISDGIATDGKGNHYITNLPEHAISKLDAFGNLSTIVQDSRLNWTDNVALSADGYIYIAVNQLHTTPTFTGGSDEGKAPYYIYRYQYWLP